MNKQLLKFSLLGSVLMLFAGMAFGQPIPPVKTADCPAVSEEIYIDGLDDENSWSEVQEFTIFSLSNEADWQGEADLSAEMKFAWDYEYFYVFVDVMDDIEHNWDGENGNFWEFDCIQLYFQLDTITVPPAYTESTLEMRFNRGDAGWISNELQMRNGYTGGNIETLWENTADGWVVEAAIPWMSIMPEGSLPENVMEYINGLIGFDMMISDSDGDDPTVGDRGNGTQMMWDEDGDEGDTADGTEDLAWNNTSTFGYLELVGASEPPPPPNDPPVADAGPDQTVDENTEVTLDGTDSYDPEGDDITFAWNAPNGGILSDYTSATPTFIAPEVHEATNFQIQLWVSDESGISGYDEVTITVNNINKPPVADAGPDRIVNERELVQIQGDITDPDMYDNFTMSWTSPQGVSFLGASNPMFVAPDVVENDTFQFVLVANDGYLDSEPDTMNLFVNALVNETDTVFIYETVYDTVYVIEPYYNTILLTVVDDEGTLIAQEMDGELFVELFPNPADQFINIRSEMEIERVELIDVQSNVVLEETVNALKAELNIGYLSPGNYFLRIQTQSGLVIKQLVLE